MSSLGSDDDTLEGYLIEKLAECEGCEPEEKTRVTLYPAYVRVRENEDIVVHATCSAGDASWTISQPSPWVAQAYLSATKGASTTVRVVGVSEMETETEFSKFLGRLTTGGDTSMRVDAVPLDLLELPGRAHLKIQGETPTVGLTFKGPLKPGQSRTEDSYIDDSLEDWEIKSVRPLQGFVDPAHPEKNIYFDRWITTPKEDGRVTIEFQVASQLPVSAGCPPTQETCSKVLHIEIVAVRKSDGRQITRARPLLWISMKNPSYKPPTEKS
jgi:hypothetical protein